MRLYGFLIRLDLDRGLFEATIGIGAHRVETHECVVVTAGPVDPQPILDSYLAGREPDAPAIPAAFALWDGGQRRLHLVRDRTGLHPLFRASAGGEFLAGSDARQLLAIQGVSNELEPLALAAWLVGVDGEPEDTLYRHLKRVPAGHMFTLDPAGRHLRRLWEPPPEGSVGVAAARRFGETLETAVGRLLTGRGAVFLSGGLDSAAVAAAAEVSSRAAGLEAPLALSVEIEGASEEREQKAVADGLGLERLSQSAAAGQGLLARGLARSADSLWPAGSIWQPVFDDLAADAREAGASIIFDGIGGDELLDAGLRPAGPALRRGRVGVLRELAAAERAYAGGGMTTVLKAARPRRPRRWVPPAFVPDAYREALAEFRATPRDDLLATRIAAAWEETWDAGLRQGVTYHHPIWSPDVVELVRGLPLEALIAGGQAKSPARAYLASRIPGITDQWPRPGVADALLVALEREYTAPDRASDEFPILLEIGAIRPQRDEKGFSWPLKTGILRLEWWLRSRVQG